jgi:hypothetical protein
MFAWILTWWSHYAFRCCIATASLGILTKKIRIVKEEDVWILKGERKRMSNDAPGGRNQG